MFKLNEDGFCDLCGCHTDHLDLYFAEDQNCKQYHACGLCKWILEDAGQVDDDGYTVLSREQINALEAGGIIIEHGAIIKFGAKEAQEDGENAA